MFGRQKILCRVLTTTKILCHFQQTKHFVPCFDNNKNPVPCLADKKSGAMFDNNKNLVPCLANKKSCAMFGQQQKSPRYRPTPFTNQKCEMEAFTPLWTKPFLVLLNMSRKCEISIFASNFKCSKFKFSIVHNTKSDMREIYHVKYFVIST